MSRSVRAAKSAWPPSDATATTRPSTWCSSASPRPVPAAMSAMLPAAACGRRLPAARGLRARSAPGRRRPSPRDRSAGGRARRRTRGRSRPRPSTPGHVGQAGRVAASPVRRRRSMPDAFDELRARRRVEERGDHRPQIGEVERARTRGPRPDAAATRCRSNRPSSVFVPPMSPASRFTIDIRFILLHLDAVPPLVRRQRRPFALTVVTHNVRPARPSRPRGTARRLHRKAQLARPQGRARARRALSAAPPPTTSTRRRRCW